MNRSIYRLFATCLLGGALIGGCVQGEGNTESVDSTYAPLIVEGETIPNQYIVVFKDDAAATEVSTAMNRVSMMTGSEVQRTYSVIPGFSAKLSASAVDALRQNPDVAYIEQDRVARLNTTYTAYADGIDRVDQRELPLDGSYNDFGNDGSGVHIVIIDTGIRSTHNDFGGRVGIGFTAITDGNGSEDCNGHGTHVASTTAGSQYGLAKNATLHASRVLDCNGSGSYSGVIDGVDWTRETCTNNGWTCVANMSLGGGFSQSVNDAVANAVAAGITFAVAAGNDSADACNYSPASEPSAITVAASDPTNDDFAYFSNYGSCVDIIAPGVDITGAWIGSDSDTNTISGTSMASPHVAGAAAQYLSANPSASPSQVQSALENNANLNCIGSTSGSPDVLLHNDFNAGTYDCGGGGGGDPDPNSCEGYCGTQAPGGCWCDSWCDFYGDCCADKALVCS